jgi:hypothetical protein
VAGALLLERRVHGGETRDRHAEGRAENVVEAGVKNSPAGKPEADMASARLRPVRA